MTRKSTQDTQDDDLSWWQSIDSDEHWQWMQTQRINQSRTGSVNTDGKNGQTDIKPSGIDGLEKSDESLTS